MQAVCIQDVNEKMLCEMNFLFFCVMNNKEYRFKIWQCDIF